MTEETAASWEEFETIIRKREDQRQKVQKRQKEGQYVSELFYRGQADSSWRLETTLGRSVHYVVSLNDYYESAKVAQPQIETVTDKSWKIPTYEQHSNWLESKPPPFRPFNPIAYPYFVYLRHHRFPSPLLDWTSSPYVAAFFAMDCPANDVKYVSVYIYWKTPGSQNFQTGISPRSTF